MAFVFMGLTACASPETEAWQNSRRMDTAAAYSDFLKAHPGGSYASEATNQYRSKLLVDCKGRKMMEACRNLLSRFPGAPEITTLKTIEIPNMLYAEATKSGTLASYREYLDNANPSHSKYQAVVRVVRGIERRDELAWKEARKGNSLEAYRKYRDLNAGGAHTSEASTRIEKFDPPTGSGTVPRGLA